MCFTIDDLKAFTIEDLKADGFVGFVPLRSFLKPLVMGEAPDVEGVYVVARESVVRPTFGYRDSLSCR